MTACMKTTYTTGAPEGGQVHTVKQKYFINGLVGGDEAINLDKLCPNGVAWFQSRMEFMDACLTGCTGSIYSPRTVEVKCAGGSSWNLTPVPEANVTVAELADGGAK